MVTQRALLGLAVVRAADTRGQCRRLVPVSPAQTAAVWLLSLLRQHRDMGSHHAGSWHEADGICCLVIRGYPSSLKAVVLLPYLVVQTKGDFYLGCF